MQATSTQLNLFQIANIHRGHFNMLNSTSIGVHALAHNLNCAEKLAPGPNTRCSLIPAMAVKFRFTHVAAA
jgi:hypothetical protein